MRFLTMVLALWVLVIPVQAEEPDAITDVIGRQLQAFNDRDVATAWTFASPMIQNMFGNPGNFGRMVQNGYPMVWDNDAAEFLERDGNGPLVRQEVFVRDMDGAGWILLYTMIETPSGWKINGVQVLPAPEFAA